MKVHHIPITRLSSLGELSRTRRDRVFEDHLLASIREVGLVEPLKVAPSKVSPGEEAQYIVVDGVLRLEAIRKIREEDSSKFSSVPAYMVPYRQRFEVRFQGDVFQDLLPSQLASLVEHLHKKEGIQKKDIARFIGISSATLRNYTGLWRLIQRGGYFADVVRLMDYGLLPASNPFAWLRLNSLGIQMVFERFFSDGKPVNEWIDQAVGTLNSGRGRKYSIQFVEEVTGSLPSGFYRERHEVRSMKKKLGELRAQSLDDRTFEEGYQASQKSRAKRHLRDVRFTTSDPSLKIAASALENALR